MQDNNTVHPEVQASMVKMVGSMLAVKPADPVPFIYSYLLELSKGVDDADIKPITDNELNEMKNLEKKITYYKEILGEEMHVTESDEESDDFVDEIQPNKKNYKQ